MNAAVMNGLLTMKYISLPVCHPLSHFARTMMEITWERGPYVPEFLVGYTARYPSAWHAMLACLALNEHTAEMCEHTEKMASMRYLTRFPVLVDGDAMYELRDIQAEIEEGWGKDSVGAVAYLMFKLPVAIVHEHFGLDFMTEDCSRKEAQAVQCKTPRLLGCAVEFWKPILQAKFGQHPDLRRRLIQESGGSLTTIVFEVEDDFWGATVVRPDGRVPYLDGENMMGNLLTDLRDTLFALEGTGKRKRAEETELLLPL